jgi:transposase
MNYSTDNGRPTIHPEVLVRALLISAPYNIISFRRLCLAISENIAFRWFCFLTIDDEVFDHSTITYFIERIGREGFKALFASFNQELLRLRLLSPKMYADSTLVKANVRDNGLSPSEWTVEEFQEKAVKENGLFVVKEAKRDEGGLIQEETKYYQDARGWIPLNPADLDARWAVELNETQAYAEQIRKRKTVIEGVSACQDRLGWSRCKLRGVWKVDCEGFLASLAHNILKLVRKLKARLGIPLCYGGQGMETEGVPTY